MPPPSGLPPSPRPNAPLARAALGALLVGLITVAGCRVVRGPWSPPPGTGPSAGADTVAVDSAGGRPAADSISPDSLPSEAAGRDTAASDTAGRDTAEQGDEAEEDRRARPDTAPADTLPDAERHSAEELEEMGPTYTPYDLSPELLPGDWLSDLLSDTLAPVVDRHDELSVQDFALYWVLVDREGDVRDAVLHTTSYSEAFDRAGRVVAERLRYRPAVADGEAVPVWVLVRVSLLMR